MTIIVYRSSNAKNNDNNDNNNDDDNNNKSNDKNYNSLVPVTVSPVRSSHCSILSIRSMYIRGTRKTATLPEVFLQ